ncbi:MAG TPA: cytochrome c [Saprospiraceae bacterium]|nr:cytochrome c [Saprospiraceae bacterium]
MKSIVSVLSGLAMIAIVVMAFTTTPQQPAPWPVPDNYKTMKNPVAFDKTAAAALYSTHCKSCHGKEGLGDGPKAAQLDTKCGDFTTATFQKQSDGSLFYKTLEGRDDMPSFKKKLPDQEDIWQLVHYVRTFEE